MKPFSFGRWAIGSFASLGIVATALCWATSAFAQVERFTPADSAAIEVWKITDDPTVRDHANYHNQPCFSTDGRYICFTHWASDGKEFGSRAAAEIHVYDLHLKKDVKIDNGVGPRWANRHNWLFYVRFRPEDGPRHEKGTQVMWHDLTSGRTERIGYGVRTLKYTDCLDRWLYGIQDFPDGRRNPTRIAVKADSPTEILPGDWLVGYNSLMVNPARPMIVSRDHNYRDYYFTPEQAEGPRFVARHFFDHGLAGENRTKPFPIMEGSHFSWSGDGTYFMAGNGQMRGTRWDEPLPSNIHFLAAIGCGDISPCGRSGRWICGDAGVAEIRVADLRSGDGWPVMETNSFLCFPTGKDHSGPYDIDLKGSPDGTKIGFISTYDMQNGPVARITGGLKGGSIHVDSTAGFPPRGRLVNAAGFGGEVIGYQRKTDTTFEGLTRGLYSTAADARLYSGRPLTSFESMLIPPHLREGLPLKSRGIRNIIRDEDSPLLMQRSSDLYAVVVRLPDRPHLRLSGKKVELIPGENHWETFGYHVFKDGRKITNTPIRPGATMPLPAAGTYTASAVEWSGLESEDSLPQKIEKSATLSVLISSHDDFSWTIDRFLVNDREVSPADARRADQSVRETLHLHDGVIHRAWHRGGQLVEQHDLNLAGEPTRRLHYVDGKLARREYYNRNGDKISTELFRQGQITESIQHGSRPRHWWYKNGVPTKYSRGSDTYVPKGRHWVRTE